MGLNYRDTHLNEAAVGGDNNINKHGFDVDPCHATPYLYIVPIARVLWNMLVVIRHAVLTYRYQD